ncbi:F-box domain-containing protein [Fusarium sp. LHS14.1]|nr:F-box domain-containing protein [Fusarium sp. LHS14.1]
MRHAADAFQVDLAEIWKKREMDDRQHSWHIFSELHRQLFLGHFDGVDQLDGDLDSYCGHLAPDLFAVLLALLPNLKHLAFGKVEIFAYVPETAMSALGVSKLPLRTLKTGFMPKDLSGLMQDLENLTLDYSGYQLEKFDFPRLKSVCLRGFCVNPQDFGRIVESCPDSLSSFAYETSGVRRSDIRVVQPFNAVAQLSKFHGTLKSLRLDLRFMTLGFYRVRMDTLPSLEYFTALETLFLTTNTIYHGREPELVDEHSLVNILPPNIVSLTLAKTTLRMTQRLRRGLLGLAEYRQRIPERVCQLKLVQCDTEEVCFDSHVKEALGEVGIDLEYEEFPRQDFSYYYF